MKPMTNGMCARSGRAGLAEVRRARRRRRSRGVRRRWPADGARSGRSIRSPGLGRPVVPAGRRVPRQLVVLAEAGDDVAERGELGGDRVAALGQAVDLGLECAAARARPRRGRCCGSRRPGSGPRPRSARPRDGPGVSSASASVCGCCRCAVACFGGLAGPLLGGGGPLLGLLDQALGLRDRAGVVLGRLAGEPLLLHGQRARGPPGPRGRQRRGPARPRARRWCAARWSPAAAASRSCSASRLAAARGSSASALGQRQLLLGVGDQCGCGSPRAPQLHHPHVLGLAARPRPGSPWRRGWPARGSGRPRVGLVEDLVGLLLGQAQHLAGPAPEPGVGGVLVLGELGARRLDLGLGVDHPLLRLGEAAAEPGLLAAELPDLRVDRVLVVAAAADHGQRCPRTTTRPLPRPRPGRGRAWRLLGGRREHRGSWRAVTGTCWVRSAAASFGASLATGSGAGSSSLP